MIKSRVALKEAETISIIILIIIIIIILVCNSSNIQAVTRTSETTPVQNENRATTRLEPAIVSRHQQLLEGDGIIHKHKMSLFLAVYEPASFQQNMLVRFMSFPPLSLWSTWPRHLQWKSVFFFIFFFFFLVRHLRPVRFGDPKGLQQRVPLDRGLRSDACSINSPSGERCEERARAVCGVVLIFWSCRMSVWEEQCGWVMGCGQKNKC